MTRLILVSGKGGVGKTTVAAATALGAARRGHRALVVSLDRAHNLGDVLGMALGPAPSAVPGVPNLTAIEADPQVELERSWQALSGYFARFLAWAGIGGVEAGEVAIFPGLEELLVLSRLGAAISSRCSRIATARARRSSPARSRTSAGTSTSPTPPTPMPSAIA